MKKTCLIPKFLQSDVLQNNIIRTKKIVSVYYDPYDDKFRICFSFDNKPNIYWSFNTKTKAVQAYYEILDKLKDRKIITDNSNRNVSDRNTSIV